MPQTFNQNGQCGHFGQVGLLKIMISYSEGNRLKIEQDGNTKVIQCPNLFLLK
jgi:hypothetical protein